MAYARTLLVAILLACPALASAQAVTTSFRSGGIEIPAYLQMPAEGVPRAVLVNLQGNPGGKIRADSPLAAAFARLGIATFAFNYRGIWGNPGPYALSSAIADTKEAVAFLQDAETRKRLGLGNAPVVLFGFSMGSAVALLTAAGDDRVAGAVAIAPCDFGYLGREFTDPRSPVKKFFDDAAPGVYGPKGPVPGGWPAFSGDMVDNREAHDFVRSVPALKGTAILFFPGLDDAVCPPEDHFLPFYRALRKAGHPRLEAHMLSNGHAPTAANAAWLRQVTADWIGRLGPATPPAAPATAPSPRPPAS